MNRRSLSSRRPGAASLSSRAALTACAVFLLVPLFVWAQQPAQPTPTGINTSGSTVSFEDYRLEPASFLVDKWPIVSFNFSMFNASETYFNTLKTSDIEATFDGRPVQIRDGALRLTASDPAHAIVLIDGSGSMVVKGGGTDKLTAAKFALLSFIESLGKDDTLSVSAFDRELYEVSPRSSNKERLSDDVENFHPRLDLDEDGIKYTDSTDLYGAISTVLERAGKQKVRNLIIVSDGMQDTEEARDALNISPSDFENYKRGEEKYISEKARKAGVRIFTIAIGDREATPRHPDNLAYVDADSLQNISNENMGGHHDDIDLPDLINRAQTSGKPYATLLKEQLEQTFAKIRQAFRYGYTLDLPLADFPRDGKEHTLEMKFRVGNKYFPSVTYSLFWEPDESIPRTTKPVVGSEVFLPTPDIKVMRANLGAIYAGSLALLGVLAVIPLFFLSAQKSLQAKAQARAVSNSVIVVRKGDPYVGSGCPNDPSELIKPGDVIVICPSSKCGRAHHLSCWLYGNSRCMVRYCGTELPIPEVVLKQHGLKSA